MSASSYPPNTSTTYRPLSTQDHSDSYATRTDPSVYKGEMDPVSRKGSKGRRALATRTEKWYMAIGALCTYTSWTSERLMASRGGSVDCVCHCVGVLWLGTGELRPRLWATAHSFELGEW